MEEICDVQPRNVAANTNYAKSYWGSVTVSFPIAPFFSSFFVGTYYSVWFEGLMVPLCLLAVLTVFDLHLAPGGASCEKLLLAISHELC